MTPAQCMKADAARSGAAALASVSAMHGVPVEIREILDLAHLDSSAELNEGMVLVLGRALGFEALAMEGEYENLPEVTVPMLVELREAGVERYGVLYAVDDAGVTVGDPKTGAVARWERARFTSLWTGSVVQLTPVEAERGALRRRLADARDPVKRVLRAVGWGPPYRPRIVMLAAWGGVAALAALAPRAGVSGTAFTWLVAVACAGSLWSWLASDTCALCSRAHWLAGGLPVAPAGAALYAVLLALPFVHAPPVVVEAGIAVALGTHVGLVVELARARVACPACLVVGVCAAGAAGVTLSSGTAHVTVFAGAAIAACVLIVVLLPRARDRANRRGREAAEALARTTVVAKSPGRVSVVAFKRAGCSACAFFEAAVKPALLATFEDAIALEERDLGNVPSAAPLVLVFGAGRTLFVGLPDDAIERLTIAIQEAMAQVPAESASAEPAMIVRVAT
ncbi:MAG: cysteine peptidase family C39 domain-containing protein [Polyangiaceae bacterium]